MSTPKASEQSVPGRRFQGTANNALTIVVVLLILTQSPTLILNTHTLPTIGLGLIVCSMVGCVFVLLLVRRESLWISREGVECTYNLFSYRTTWDNIERLAPLSYDGLGITFDHLILREPAVDTGRWLTLHASGKYRRQIPIGLFAIAVRYRQFPFGHYSVPARADEILQEIGKYAPRLLAQGAQDTSTASSLD